MLRSKNLEHTLNISELERGFIKIKIGELSKEVIDKLKLNIKPCKIEMWGDRFEYIHKHLKNYEGGKEQFDLCMSKIPIIINKPDYVALHPTKNSIEFIKRIDKLLIVVIRLKQSGSLAFRTAYPLSESQLNNYIKCGTAIKFSDNT